MSFPTSTWGQANFSDIYTSLPTASGLKAGDSSLLTDGSRVQFVLCNAQFTANQAGIIFSWPTNYSVTPSTAANQYVIAVNDRTSTTTGFPTGATVAAASYTWMTVKGLCYPLCAAATGAAAFVVSGAAAGTLNATTLATDAQSNITNLVLVGGSAAASPCFMG